MLLILKVIYTSEADVPHHLLLDVARAAQYLLLDRERFVLPLVKVFGDDVLGPMNALEFLKACRDLELDADINDDGNVDVGGGSGIVGRELELKALCAVSVMFEDCLESSNEESVCGGGSLKAWNREDVCYVLRAERTLFTDLEKWRLVLRWLSAVYLEWSGEEYYFIEEKEGSDASEIGAGDAVGVNMFLECEAASDASSELEPEDMHDAQPFVSMHFDDMLSVDLDDISEYMPSGRDSTDDEEEELASEEEPLDLLETDMDADLTYRPIPEMHLQYEHECSIHRNQVFQRRRTIQIEKNLIERLADQSLPHGIMNLIQADLEVFSHLIPILQLGNDNLANLVVPLRALLPSALQQQLDATIREHHSRIKPKMTHATPAVPVGPSSSLSADSIANSNLWDNDIKDLFQHVFLDKHSFFLVQEQIQRHLASLNALSSEQLYMLSTKGWRSKLKYQFIASSLNSQKQLTSLILSHGDFLLIRSYSESKSMYVGIYFDQDSEKSFKVFGRSTLSSMEMENPNFALRKIPNPHNPYHMAICKFYPSFAHNRLPIFPKMTTTGYEEEELISWDLREGISMNFFADKSRFPGMTGLGDLGQSIIDPLLAYALEVYSFDGVEDE
jgi:hypothetical protein